MKCLKGHESELSASCAAGQAKMKERRKGMKGKRGERGTSVPAETEPAAPEAE